MERPGAARSRWLRVLEQAPWHHHHPHSMPLAMPLAMPICPSEPEWVMPVALSGRYWIDSGHRKRGGEAGDGGLAAPFSTPSVLFRSSRRSTLTVLDGTQSAASEFVFESG
jgi:hypothetical protein